MLSRFRYAVPVFLTLAVLCHRTAAEDENAELAQARTLFEKEVEFSTRPIRDRYLSRLESLKRSLGSRGDARGKILDLWFDLRDIEVRGKPQKDDEVKIGKRSRLNEARESADKAVARVAGGSVVQVEKTWAFAAVQLSELTRNDLVECHNI